MRGSFILSCESTVDLPYEYVHGREIPLLFYTYSVDGMDYPDDMGRNPGALKKFYQFLAMGKFPKTSQLNMYQYEEFFEGLLEQGDVLHIVFGSGMTRSIRNAEMAAEVMRLKYPERKLIVVDSLCSSSGYGLLVDVAADMRDAGRNIEEVAEWADGARHCVHHQFFSTDLQYFRHSGRISGPTAMIATILGICPIMRLDECGKIVSYDKARGKQRAIQVTVDTMEQNAVGGRDYSGKCMICHSNCLEDAERLKRAIQTRFPHIEGEIRICDIGTIIAAHCGPGTVAAFFFGSPR